MEQAPDLKRSRTELSDLDTSTNGTAPGAAGQAALLQLPVDVLFVCCSWLDCTSLVRLQATCRAFRAHLSRSHGSQLPMVEKAAREAMMRKYSSKPSMATRWEHYTWLQRLRIEETESEFDTVRCSQSGFQFIMGPDNAIERLKLEGIGPRMLVSKDTTANAPFLRWRLEVRGNNAVELGVVPESLQDSPKALHKCHASANDDRPTGLFSSITVGSMLPLRVPLMKGSDIEVLAWPEKLEFLIRQPPDGYEMTWINSTTVPRPYTGPREMHFNIKLELKNPFKLALTCWAHAEFSLPGSGVARDTNNFPNAEVMAAAAAVMVGGELPADLMPAVVQLPAPVAPQPPVQQNGVPAPIVVVPVPAGQQQPQEAAAQGTEQSAAGSTVAQREGAGAQGAGTELQAQAQGVVAAAPGSRSAELAASSTGARQR